jgi:hypothetical protein
MIKFDQRQQAALERFFKEETTWSPWHVVTNAVLCILVGLSLPLLVFPARSMEGKRDFLSIALILGLYNMGVTFYASKFSQYKDELTRQYALYDLLKYLPVTREQLALFRVRRIWRICLPLTVAVIVLRNVFSFAFYHGISVYDFIIPLAGMLLLPVLLNLAELNVR